MLLCQAIHEPLRFISFLPGKSRTKLVYVRSRITGGSHASILLPKAQIFQSGGIPKPFYPFIILPLFYATLASIRSRGSMFCLPLPTAYQWKLSERTFPPLIETSFPAGPAHWCYWEVHPVTLSLRPLHIYYWPWDLCSNIHMVSACSELRVQEAQTHTNIRSIWNLRDTRQGFLCSLRSSPK